MSNEDYVFRYYRLCLVQYLRKEISWKDESFMESVERHIHYLVGNMHHSQGTIDRDYHRQYIAGYFSRLESEWTTVTLDSIWDLACAIREYVQDGNVIPTGEWWSRNKKRHRSIDDNWGVG